jgi:hypothetical protein
LSPRSIAWPRTARSPRGRLYAGTAAPPPGDAWPLGRRADLCGSREGRGTATVPPLGLPIVELPPEVDEPALLPPELEPPRDVALPVVEPPVVGRRLSCAMAGTASASVRSALRETLVDACMANPLSREKSNSAARGTPQNYAHFLRVSRPAVSGRPARRTARVLKRYQ